MKVYKHMNILQDDDPLFEACTNGDVEAVAAYLKADGSSYAASENKASLFGYAMRYGHLDIIKEMLAHDLKINGPVNRFGKTPLSKAITNNHPDIVRYLLQNGADVNHTDIYGCSIFTGSFGSAPLEIIKLLLEAGGNLLDRSYKGISPFLMAAQESRFETMEFLLGLGVDINEPDDSKKTPLIGSAKRGRPDTAQWLLDHGADILAKDDRGMTALDWATANGHTKVVELLQQRMGS